MAPLEFQGGGKKRTVNGNQREGKCVAGFLGLRLAVIIASVILHTSFAFIF